MRLWKAGSMLFMLVVPFAGGVSAFPAAASADTSCDSYSFLNPYVGHPVGVPPVQLSEGSTGQCVVFLQEDLNDENGANLVVDGDFGPATRAAVENYQEQHLACTRGADGLVGPYTMSCLVAGSG